MAHRHAAASQLRSDGNGGARRLAALATAVRQWCCNLRWYFACWFDGIRALYATLPAKAFIALPLDGPAIARRHRWDGAAPTGWGGAYWMERVISRGRLRRQNPKIYTFTFTLLILSAARPLAESAKPKKYAVYSRILWCRPGALTPLLCLVETAIRDRNRQ